MTGPRAATLPRPTPAPADAGKRRVVLLAGHEPARPGASSVDGTTEYDFNSRLAGLVQARLERGGLVDSIRIERAATGYARLPEAIDRYLPLFAVELHFNAGGGSGTETLHWHRSPRGKVLAGLVQAACVEALGLRDRGLQPCAADDRGGYLLGHTRCVCVIAEPFFGDNARDWRRANERLAVLADALACAIERAAEAIPTQH